MKKIIATLLFVFATSAGTLFAFDPGNASYTRETVDVAMAKNAVMTSLMTSASLKGRYACSDLKNYNYACAGPDKAELGLALIAARSSSESIFGLISFTALRFDAGLSTDYACRLIEGKAKVLAALPKANPDQLHSQCVIDVTKIKGSNTGIYSDVDVSQVCEEPEAIRKKIADYARMLKSVKNCDDDG